MPALPRAEPAAASEHDASGRAATGAAEGGGGAAGGALRLEAPVGEGGLCRVWCAQTAAGERVALKTLKTPWDAHPEAAALLRREWALLERLRHPNVVSAFALIEHQGAPGLVMEYLGGGDLTSLVGAHPRYWIGAVHDVGHALQWLAGAGVAHRDVKAGNVLLGEDGRARLIDFGSAAPIGTAPEKGGVTAAHRPPGASDALVSAEEDTYALAVLVYQMMSGRLPHGPRPTPGAAGAPPRPLRAEWRDDPLLGTLADAVQAVLASPGVGNPGRRSGTASPRSLSAARTRGTRPPRDGRLSAFLDVIESVVAAYPRQCK